MNLLSLIIIFLALVICGAVAYIAWELTAEQPPARRGHAPAAGDEASARSSRDPADTPD